MEAAQRRCYRHPDRETGLSCSECGRPICYECMTPAPVGLRCPDHSGKPQGVRKVTVAAGRAMSGEGSRRAYVVTTTLIGICVAVYLAELALGSGEGGTYNWIYNHGTLFANGLYIDKQVVTGPPGAIDPGHVLIGVSHGQWWRLLTSVFLHYGILHLGLNMLSLYFGGRLLEVVIGRWRFLLLFVVAGLAGSAGALVINPDTQSAGASGAIFGVFGALLVLERRRTIHTGGQILMLIILNLAFSFAVPNISYGAHIGGLIAGILLMLAYLRFRASTQLAVVAACALAVASVVIAYAAVG
ncbi:MAG: rhomboid family intramembrane serine protease [Nitrososphaerales archaeon]